MTLKNNRAPLLYHRSPETANFGLTSVTLTFDFWPWPFASTPLLSMLITPENFIMMQWWEHNEKGVTDRRTNREMERSVLKSCLVDTSGVSAVININIHMTQFNLHIWQTSYFNSPRLSVYTGVHSHVHFQQRTDGKGMHNGTEVQ